MEAREYPCVRHLGDGVGEAREASVDSRQAVRGDGEADTVAEERLQDGDRGTADARVGRGIFLKVRRDKQWKPSRVRGRVRIAVELRLNDRRNGSPGIESRLGVPNRERGISLGQVHESKQAGSLQEVEMMLLGKGVGDAIPHVSRGIELPELRGLRLIGASHRARGTAE